MTNTIIKDVQQYYGEVLQTKEDLKTSACCPIDAAPVYLRSYMANIHEEVQSKFYGCGSPIPHDMEGRTVLDLGCGTGRDVYTMSQIVGEGGKVIGVDMTENQLAIAKKHINYHMDKFGFNEPNVEFHQGYIEDLEALGIEDNSVDVVTSNCVINLSPNKEEVFREIFRILKPGGELYFSDVFTSRRVPEDIAYDPILLGECLGGALYIEDFRRILYNVGCLDYRIVSKSKIELHDKEIIAKVGDINFYSITVRTFKSDFEDICEDYGHIAYYNGTIEQSPDEFMLDDHHVFRKNEPVKICGNTAKMLIETHYSKHFRVEGDFSVHLGEFDCSLADNIQSGGCC